MLIAFYLLALIAVLFALGVLFLRNPIYCALSLVGSFFSLGCIYILLNREFVAVIQVLVYAGAIMVLFLFVVMLLSTQPEKKLLKFKVSQLGPLALVIILCAQFVTVFSSSALRFGPKGLFDQAMYADGSIAVIGKALYGQYALALEVISVLMLVAIIGAVVIAKRKLV